MPSSDSRPSIKIQGLVAGLLWGVFYTVVLGAVARLLSNHHRVTGDEFLPAGWMLSIEFAAPLGLLVGGIGGYRWVTSGQATTSASAHGKRVVFVGALLLGSILGLVLKVTAAVVLGDQLWTSPVFVLPTVIDTSVLVVSYLVAYRL